MIDFEQAAFNVDATIIGESLGIEPSTVHSLMRTGLITSMCEQGVGEDAGQYRLSFFLGNQRLRLIIAGPGTIRKRSVVNFGEHPLPSWLRRPAAA